MDGEFIHERMKPMKVHLTRSIAMHIERTRYEKSDAFESNRLV